MQKDSPFSRHFMLTAVLCTILGIGMLANLRVAQAQYPVYAGNTCRAGYGINHWNAYSQPVGTGVFINGRQLSFYQVARLQQIFGYVMPGSYWLRPDGTFGRVGGPALGNVYMVIQARQQGSYATSPGPIRHHTRDTVVAPRAVLLPDGTSYTW